MTSDSPNQKKDVGDGGNKSDEEVLESVKNKNKKVPLRVFFLFIVFDGFFF